MTSHGWVTSERAGDKVSGCGVRRSLLEASSGCRRPAVVMETEPGTAGGVACSVLHKLLYGRS